MVVNTNPPPAAYNTAPGQSSIFPKYESSGNWDNDHDTNADDNCANYWGSLYYSSYAYSVHKWSEGSGSTTPYYAISQVQYNAIKNFGADSDGGTFFACISVPDTGYGSYSWSVAVATSGSGWTVLGTGSEPNITENTCGWI